MADIFVSYAAEDRDRVAPLINVLQAHGWSVWWDRELVAGPSFEQRIQQALDTARCVVVAWSQHSVGSRWCQAEATEGLDRDVLVPLRLDDVRVPLPFRAAHTPALLDWPGAQGELEAVLAGVRECLGGAGDEVQTQGDGQPFIRPQPRRHHRAWWAAGGAALVALGAVATWLAWTGREQPWQPERVAVLALRNLSPDADIDHIAKGLTDELRRQLDGSGAFDVLPDVFVRNRSVDELRSAADIVVDGSVRADGDNVEVSLDVVRLAGNEPVWSDIVRGPRSDPLRLQRQIAGHIARVFDSTVPQWAGPRTPEAYAAYLRFTAAGPVWGDHEQAMYWLARVNEIEPDWAGGWGERIAYSVAQYFWFGDSKDLHDAEAALNTLQAIEGGEETLAWGRAHIDAYGHGRFEAAEPAFGQFAKWGDATWYVNLMLASGLYTEAEAAAERVLESQPQNQGAWEHVALARANLGDRAGAARAFDRLVLLAPPDAIPQVTVAIGAAFADDEAGEAQAIARLQRQMERARPGSLTERKARNELQMVMFLRHVHLGETDQARAVADHFAAVGQPFRAAIFYFQIDDPRADAQLELARRAPSHLRLGWNYSTAPLSAEQRTSAFIRELEKLMGFTPEWRLELCRRAALMPPETGISCEPAAYALAESATTD